MADYKCTSVGCYDYQSPQMHTNILALQNAVNRFSGDADYGFQPIAVDGVVGKGTVQALLLVMTSIAQMNPDASPIGLAPATASNFFDAINGPEDVMQQMTDLVPFLQNVAGALGQPNVPAPMISSAPTRSITPTGVAANAAFTKIQAAKPAVAGSLIDSIQALPLWAKIGLGIGALVGGAAAYKHFKR